MGVGLGGEAHLESILKADSSLRMLAAPLHKVAATQRCLLHGRAVLSQRCSSQSPFNKWRFASMAQTAQARKHANAAAAATTLSFNALQDHAGTLDL